MKFDRILEKLVWRLLHERRLSYRWIKRSFDLDDAALEDILYVLVQEKSWAVDEDGKFLVWAADVLPTPRALSLVQPSAKRNIDATLSTPAISPASEASRDRRETAGAERRQITVMFCDLVGSTDLSSRLDPEDLADIIRAYQDAATIIIRRFDGFVAQYLGDGVLVYFGYPQALERDAERAVRTSLAILDALPILNSEIGRAKNVTLAVRLGIATGLVMVGESIGSGAATQKTIVGETPNLAARLQSLAEPNSIVVSQITRELAGNAFVYSDLGHHQLKGFPEPVSAWSVTGLADPVGESEAHENASSLVGRDEEIGLLRRAWQQSRNERRGQVVLISGEPGIGKSSLVRILRADVQKQSLPRLTFRCSSYHSNSAFYPIIEHLKQASGWQPEDGDQARLDKLERMLAAYALPHEDLVLLMAALMSLPVAENRYPQLQLAPKQLKQQTEDVLVALTMAEAERQPILQVWEDLHWADPSTLEVLGLIIDQVPTASLLVVLTFRPEFVPQWPIRSHMTPLTLSRLERPQVKALVTQLAGGKELPRDVVKYIVRKTDGVPLYVEELTKAVLASGNLREEAGTYVLIGLLATLSIPASLQEVLMSRLDRLPTVRDVAQLGAVLGREFAYDMLLATAIFEEAKLRDGLGQLVSAELLYQRGRPPRATYTFKHALIRDAAYQSLLKRTRQQYHQQAGALLERRFAAVVEAQPELLAHHFAEAGLFERAVAYFHKAGQRDARRSASQEVIAHVRRALELLTNLPETPERSTQELELQHLLGTALMATQGYAAPETGLAFRRAREICRTITGREDIYPVLFGVILFELTRANHAVAAEVAEEFLTRAKAEGRWNSRMVGHVMVGTMGVFAGTFTSALAHFREAIVLHDPEEAGAQAYRYGVGIGAGAFAHAAFCDWLLGHPEQAVEHGRQMMTESERTQHPFTMSRGLYWNATLHQFRRDWTLVRERAERAIGLAKERGFALVVAGSKVLHGAACAALGEGDMGIREMHEALDAYDRTGGRFYRSYYLAMLAEALLGQARFDAAGTALLEASSFVEATGERYYAAEIHRLRGALLLACDSTDGSGAEASLRTALAVARGQEAKSFELRAARDLATLWGENGERQKSYDLLHPIYTSFTEGLDTSDLITSKHLLDSLR